MEEDTSKSDEEVKKAKEDIEKDLKKVEAEAEKYDLETYKPAKKALVDIQRQLKAANPEQAHNTASASTKEQRWKPRDEYKPNKLSSSDRPTVLDTWLSKLSSYLSGHEKLPFNDIFNLLDDLIADDVKNSVGFNHKNEMPVFGKNSLAEKLKAQWQEEYPINQLRMAWLKTDCFTTENWDQWITRFFEEAEKAEIFDLSVRQLAELMAIHIYKGPLATEMRKKLTEESKSDNKEDISVSAATKIWKRLRFVNNSHGDNSVKQVSNQLGGRSNNRGPRSNGNSSSNNNRGSSHKGHAVYNQGQTKPGTRFNLEDSERGKQLLAGKRCLRCSEKKCPAAGKVEKCPKQELLTCDYCKKLPRSGFSREIWKGHVEAACIKKWRHFQNNNGVKQLMNSNDGEGDQLQA